MLSRTTVLRTTLTVLVAGLLFATACTTPGHPVARYPVSAELPVGPYSVRPLEAPAGDEEHGRILEAIRMAEAVIEPVEADAALTEPFGGGGLMPLPTPARAATLLALPVRAVLEKYAMVTGVAVASADRELSVPVAGKSRLLTVMVLRFRDAETAAAAARDIDATDAAVNTDNVSVPIPGRPRAHAHWRPGVPTLAATEAHESYVVSVLAGDLVADLTALTGLARNAFDKQTARLGDYAPTSVDQLATLPLDRDGMLARMAPYAPGRWSYPGLISVSRQVDAGWGASLVPTGVVLGPRALLLQGRKSSGIEPELHAISGLDALMRYTAASDARAVVERKAKSLNGSGFHVIDRPAGVPEDDMTCLSTDQPTDDFEFADHLCMTRVGRYVAINFARSEQLLRQRAAVQYALLAAGEN